MVSLESIHVLTRERISATWLIKKLSPCFINARLSLLDLCIWITFRNGKCQRLVVGEYIDISDSV